MIPKWSGERHLEIRLLYTNCCKIGILNSNKFGKLRKWENGLMWSVTSGGDGICIKSKENGWFHAKSAVFAGPSGEIRTPGILNPKTQVFIFLNFYAPFSGVYSGNSSFPELSVPLFPGVRILSMVKNVVKSIHSPKGSSTFGECFLVLRCRDCSLEWKVSQVFSQSFFEQE